MQTISIESKSVLFMLNRYSLMRMYAYFHWMALFVMDSKRFCVVFALACSDKGGCDMK